MSMPFYVSPEQLMKDRADYARKGIARGRSVVAVQFADGVLFVSENPSQALHKVSEIYDRIAFAAVGKYNEFENLRVAGVRYAEGASLEAAVRLAVSALGHTEEGDRVIPAEDLEVAVLDRTRSQPRKFVRVMPSRLGQLLGERGPTEPNPESEAEHMAVPADGPESPPSPSPVVQRDEDEPPIAPPG